MIDSGDIDLYGDIDFILSAFTYVFVPVPPALTAAWGENDADIMVLENTLIDQ